MFRTFILRILMCIAALWFCISDSIALRGVNVNIPEQTTDPALIERDAMSDAWAATDGLGRVLPMSGEAREARGDRFVGLFYWTWHVSHAKWVTDPVNVNEVVTNDPSASHDLDNPAWSALGMPHHWDEPLYGFYDTDDRWVLRRHAELLAAAGVDVIIFDCTNGTATWKDSYDVLFEVFAQARADGVRTPQIAFLLPFFNGDDNLTQLRMLYDDIYSKGRYSDLWFYWKGKPLIMSDPDAVRGSEDPTDKEIYAFFTFRPGIAEYNVSNEQKKGDNVFSQAFNPNQYWSWLSVYPQVVNYNNDGTPEQMAVSVAQNWSAELGLTAMNGENVFGRTYTSKGYDTSENAALKGANFAEQAQRALEIDPEFVFITGWNEWVAGRFEEWCGVTNAFPDEFNDEYSRDIEPTKGPLKDHYYYQMADFIRRYKGVRADAPDTEPNTITALSDWEQAGKLYRSYSGNAFDRDDVGYAGIRYTDASGRNDIVSAKAASDGENLYFLVECAENIRLTEGGGALRLLLSVPGAENTWEGYSHVVNCSAVSDGKAAVERSTGGWSWENAGEAEILADGEKLSVKLPKAALGVSGDRFTVDFKWTDNTLETGDIMDFYTRGDTAPTGRFNYRYAFGN